MFCSRDLECPTSSFQYSKDSPGWEFEVSFASDFRGLGDTRLGGQVSVTTFLTRPARQYP